MKKVFVLSMKYLLHIYEVLKHPTRCNPLYERDKDTLSDYGLKKVKRSSLMKYCSESLSGKFFDQMFSLFFRASKTFLSGRLLTCRKYIISFPHCQETGGFIVGIMKSQLFFQQKVSFFY